MGETRTEHLARYAASLQYGDIPAPVVQRTKELFLDWLGCTIAGRHHPAVAAIVRYATQMGPSSGKSELVDGSLGFSTSPAFASLINAAASHVVEQDDLHNRSIMHPVCLLSVDSMRVSDLNIGNSYFPCYPCCGARYRCQWPRFHHGLCRGL